MQVHTSAPPLRSNTLHDLQTASQPSDADRRTHRSSSTLTIYLASPSLNYYYVISTNSYAWPEPFPDTTAATMSAPGPDNPMHDDDNHFAPPSSAQGSSLKRVIKSRSPALLTTAAPARRTFFDSWNSSSTGHQRAENRLSGSTSWHASRNLKLCEQYKGCLAGGGNRVQDTVGAGSEDFGKDGRKENGGWERCAKGLKTGGQKSSAEFWSVSKASKTSVLSTLR